MKKIKYILSLIALMAVAISCSIEGISDDTSLSAAAPTNVVGIYNVTQDNTGLVTITPTGEGAASYDIYYGDETTSPVHVEQGDNTSHIYAEGTYTVKIVAIGITGAKTEVTQSLVVSFKAPQNLEVEITNDLAVSKKVSVTATADLAIMFDVYFGEPGNDVPVSANIGGTVSYTYQTAGTYTIRVVAKGAGIETTEHTESFEVTAILQPTTSAPNQPNRQSTNVISIYSSAYANVAGSNFNPNWGQAGTYAEFDLNGDKMLNYINLNYQGITIGSHIDASSMQFLHIDIWSADNMSIDIFPIPSVGAEKFVTKTLVANQWNSFDIPLSDFTSQGLPLNDLKEFKFVGNPPGKTVFIDNLYFYKEPVSSTALVGTWKMAPEAGALKVGPSAGSGEWWSNDAQAVIDRACYFDDTFVFSSSGAFSNVLGTATWLEPWQGVSPEACGTPVAPHNGAAATYLYDAGAGTLKINGSGAYIGLPKVNNAGELPNVAVPASITYNITLSDSNNTMTVVIQSGAGTFWTYKLIRI